MKRGMHENEWYDVKMPSHNFIPKKASDGHDAIISEIRRGMNDVKSQSEFEAMMKKLEVVQKFKARIQEEKMTELLKENDELQNLRANLQNTYSNLRGYGERMNWANLTEDLQIEILARLPRKSLMRFKCVQRSWNVLFKTPLFENKRRMHNSENGYHVNESVNRSGYPKMSSWSKPKNLVKKMSHVDIVAEIRSGIFDAKRANDLKTEMRFLEEVLICKAELQNELSAKHQKDNAVIQKLTAALEKRIDKVLKETTKTDEEAAGGLR